MGRGASLGNDLPSFDPVLQAATWIMSRYGGPARPERHGFASCIDYLTGYRRLRHGAGAAAAQARGRR